MLLREQGRVADSRTPLIHPRIHGPGQVGAVLAPISLFWLAFTTYRGVHWIVPILATVPFSTATYFIFASSMSP
jgi:hypothetical protein